jgi:hypothetical protein
VFPGGTPTQQGAVVILLDVKVFINERGYHGVAAFLRPVTLNYFLAGIKIIFISLGISLIIVKTLINYSHEST